MAATISPKQNPADIQLTHTSGLIEFMATNIFIIAQKAQMMIVIASPILVCIYGGFLQTWPLW
jgi:hypothetical protein